MARFIGVALLVNFMTTIYGSTNGACESYFDNLTTVVGVTYSCFGKYSQPLSLCGQCHHEFKLLERLFDDTETKNPIGTPCNFFLRRENLLQPLARAASSIQKIWHDAYCNQCIIESNPTSNLEPTSFDFKDNFSIYNLSAYNNLTQNFFKYVQNFANCVSAHVLNSDVSPLDPINFPNQLTIHLNKSVCSDCVEKYTQLYKAYETWAHLTSGDKNWSWLIKETTLVYHHELCTDAVDAMNRSETVWSTILHCPNPSNLKVSVLLLPLTICIIVGIFHLTVLPYYPR